VWEGKELVLTGNEPVKAATLTLQRPTTIRGKLGQRGVIAVGADGWHIAADEIRFENIDFVADELAAGNPMIRLAARRAEFIGCSWQQTIAEPSTALAWNPPKNAAAETILRGEIHLIDCLLQRVGGGIRTAGGAAVLIELANVLHLGPGPLVTLDEAPETGEAIELMATHVTLRDAQGLLACNCDAIPDEPGRFLIVTDDCVLVPATAAGLILFSGAHQPAPLLRSIEWKGQGSVVATQASLCVWRDNEGTLRGAADDQLHAAGLVRNDVTFSGANNHGPAGSRVVRWQAPRQSADPPGIRETKPLPSGMLR
jgi:hypothetical protein